RGGHIDYFFSSRRRHTRFARDWGSDVCSSDLNHVITRRTLTTGFSFHLAWDRHDIHGRCLRQWGDRGIYDYRFEWDLANRRTLRSEEPRVGKACRSPRAQGLDEKDDKEEA